MNQEKAIIALNNRINLLDKKAESGEFIVIEKIFEVYGELAAGVCRILRSENFNFYTKSSPHSPNLGGILTLYEVGKPLSLQYVKLPIDNKTVAGYAYQKKLAINITDIAKKIPEHSDLDPVRVFEVDKKLKRITKEIFASPIINQRDEILGVVEVTNSKSGDPFSLEIQNNLKQISEIISNSLATGFFSFILPAFVQQGKSRQNTSIMPEMNAPDEVLSEDDFSGKTTEKKSVKEPLFLNLNTTQTLENPDTSKQTPDSHPSAKKTDKADIKDSVEVETEIEKEYIEEEASEENEENTSGTSNDKNAEIYATLLSQLKSDKKPDPEEYPPLPDKNKYYDTYSPLVINKLIDERDLHNCKLMAESEEKPIEPFLIIHHKISLLEIGKAMAQFYKLPYSPYDPTIVKPESIINSLKVKTDFFQRSKFLPVGIEKNQVIKVICNNPIELEDSGVLKQVFRNFQFRLCVTTDIEFQYSFQLLFGESDAGKMDELLNKLATQYGDGVSDDYDPERDELGISENEMVVLVNKIITDAYARNASDIHIEPYPGKAKTRVRFRIDGSLIEVLALPSTIKDAIITRIKVMANLDISDRRRPQDGKIAMKKFSSLNIELRIATVPTAGGLEDVVMRILASGEPLPMEKLGVLPENEAKLIPIIEKPYGIIFVCGPTGSGKTTTLHSILKHLNNPDTKIWTAEDPVEITQAGLRQVQVNKKAGLDFATVMRAFLRCDPDIIMVGEMRDFETVSIGIEASLTGHLVLSTLHTNSAPEAIVRLLDMGMDPFNFADALLGILAQRLTKRLCKCKEGYVADEDEINLMATEFSLELVKIPAWIKDHEGERKKLIDGWYKRFGKNGKITLYKAVGCGSCSNTGYKGRMGLHELMVGSDRIRRMVQQKARVEELVGACLEEGMLTLKMDGMLKVLEGVTDMKQVRQVCIK